MSQNCDSEIRSSILGQYGASSGMANRNAPRSQDSMSSILDEIAKMAHEVKAAAGIVADALSGPIPMETKDGCSQPADNVMDKLRSIRLTLNDAIQNQQRIRNTLSL